MPTETATRLNKAGDVDGVHDFIEIDRLVDLGVPIKRACEQVGVPRIAYYRRRWEKEKAESPAKESRPSTSPEDGSPSSIGSENTRSSAKPSESGQ